MQRKTTILVGDALHSLPTLPHQSIQSIVTSPPYWGLRDYGVAPSEWPEIAYQPMPGLPAITIEPMTCCLGLESTPEAFVGHLLHVFRLARKALREDGTCFVNLGDSYARVAGGYSEDGSRGSSALVSKKAQISTVKGRQQVPPVGLKAKDLVGIPWRFAFAMQADGWYLRSDVIWAKANPMPESVTDRPTRAHEYVFMFAKSERYYAGMDDVKEPATVGANGSTFTRGKTAINGGPHLGQGPRNDDGFRNLRSVWQSASTPFAAKNIGITDADHYAVMAEPIVDKCIRIGCPKGGTVLDPFGGAGTTGLLASRLERNAVLCEINPDSARIAKARIEAEDSLFYRVETTPFFQ